MHNIDAEIRIKKKLDRNKTRMLRTILNKSWKQQPTKEQLYCHLPPMSKRIQVKQTRHAGHSWRCKDELISDVLLWTPTRPLTSHLTHHPSKTSKTCGTLLEMQGRTHKWRSSMDPYTWTCQCWPISKNLFTSALCRDKMLFGGPAAESDGW